LGQTRGSAMSRRGTPSASSRPDVTHLHWVNHGMLSLRERRAPAGPASGRCTIRGRSRAAATVRRNAGSSGNVAAAVRNWARGATRSERAELNRKRAAWETAAFAVVAPSRWLADRREVPRCWPAGARSPAQRGGRPCHFRPKDRAGRAPRTGVAG
jgi:hypothetical protein